MRCPRCGFDENESSDIELWDFDKLTVKPFKDWIVTETDLLMMEEEYKKAKLYINIA